MLQRIINFRSTNIINFCGSFGKVPHIYQYDFTHYYCYENNNPHENSESHDSNDGDGFFPSLESDESYEPHDSETDDTDSNDGGGFFPSLRRRLLPRIKLPDFNPSL